MRISRPEVRAASNATKTAIADAEQEIANQLTLLPKDPSGIGNAADATVGLLRTIRSNIREAIRMRSGGDKDAQAAAKLLREAEKELTEGISKALPAKAAARLRKADAQYGKYKVLEDAAFKAGDTETGMGAFTPARITSALKAAAKQRGSIPEFNRGGGGELRTLSSEGAKTLKEVTPTGYGASMAGGPLGYVFGPPVALANTPALKPFMLGQTAPQRFVSGMVDEAAQKLPPLNTQAALQQALAEIINSRKDTP